MADNFSLDDILAEVELKKSKRASSASSSSSEKFSITDILSDEIRIKDDKNKGRKASVEIEKPKAEEKPIAVEPPKVVEKVAPVEQPKPKVEEKVAFVEPPRPKTQDKYIVPTIPEPKKSGNKEGIFFKKPSKRGVSSKTAEIPEKIIPKTSEIPIRLPEKTAEIEVKPVAKTAEIPVYDEAYFDEKEQLLSTGSIEIDDKDLDPKKLFGTEKKERKIHKKKKKGISKEEKNKLLQTMQLDTEEALEDPDDLIDAINPLEIKDKAATDFDEDFFVGSDTMGLAGNDLKALAQTDNKKKDTLEINGATKPIDKEAEKMLAQTTEHVKTYEPAPKKPQPSKDKGADTALISSLNKAIEKKRQEDANSFLKPNITGTLGTIPTPPDGLNIDYSSKVIYPTAPIPELEAEKKKKKLRDFVLENDEDDEIDEKDELEFDSYDTTGQIWADLCESHKGLKTRFVFMLLITAALFFVSLIGDMGYHLGFNILGLNVTFLDKIDDPQGFVFFNLILGVLGAILCSSIIVNGLTKLFRGKADCDSICSLVTVVSLIVTFLFILDFNDLQLGRAFIFVPVAMATLLFNTLGKMLMIVRAKRNFRFISGDSKKYSAVLMRDDATANAFAKGVVREIPYLAAMRKTEFLTDFLKNSYCEDRADKISKLLTPISAGVALVLAVIAYFVPNGVAGMENNLYWSLSVATATLGILSPFSMMFVVNYPLSRAGKALAKTDSVVLGYNATEEFSDANALVIDASTLFPAGTTLYSNIKHLSQPNSINNIALDQAIILAASLAIKSGSVLSNMFRDMINDKEEILAKIDNCVYEDNMGVLGWFGNKRMIMGNREQMKHHDIKIPDMKKVRKYTNENTDTLYLAVGGEIIIMFFVQLIANKEIKEKLKRLQQKGVALVVKTTDSIVTVSKLAEIFELDPEMIKILPYSMHEQYNVVTRYVSRGNGALSCSGTFTSLSSAILAAKGIVKDVGLGCGIMLGGAILGGICAAALGAFAQTSLLTPTLVTCWNTTWLIVAMIAQSFRKY